MTDETSQAAGRMTLEELQERGERIRKYFHDRLGVELAYDRATVEWLDGFIGRNRHLVTDDLLYVWSLALGYILGESVRRTIGGEWEWCDEFREWGVDLGDGVGLMNPIGKVWKFLRSPEDSVLSFYEVAAMAKERGWDNIG
ncbi:MAG TPA: hypothetical protein VF771_04820 [Longimicrobiaceae bacterium]